MRGLKLFAYALLAASLGLGPAAAQEKYPNRPVRVVVPFAPGGGVDIVARVVAEHLKQATGQPFIVENKPGAFGIVAIETMAAARPDGYTLMIGNVATNAMTPIFYRKKFRIDYDKEVVAVARLSRVPSFLISTTKLPPKTVDEFVAYARQRPGQLRYNTTGTGTFVHLDNVAFARKAGLELGHVPVKSGAAEMLKEIINGDVHITFMNAGTGAPHIRAGNVHALAVASDRRLPDFPDVPTMAEVGFPGVGTAQWQAVFAPAATPPDVIAALHAAVRQALASPALQETFAKSYIYGDPSASPQDAQAFLRAEMASWAKALEEAKIEPEE
jgi:tripartite-type tricarboxylate transporter receptor subunit TctC